MPQRLFSQFFQRKLSPVWLAAPAGRGHVVRRRWRLIRQARSSLRGPRSSSWPTDSSLPKALPATARGTCCSRISRTTAFSSGPWTVSSPPVKQPCGRSNGLCFDAAGNLWACADEKNELWCVGPGREGHGRGEGVRREAPQRTERPLDSSRRRPLLQRPVLQEVLLAARPAGAGRPGGLLPSARPQTTRRVAADLVQPNGVIGTPDGKTLYVADIGAGKRTPMTFSRTGAWWASGCSVRWVRTG